MNLKDLLNPTTSPTPTNQKDTAHLSMSEGASLSDNSVSLGNIGQIGNSITGLNSSEIQGILSQNNSAVLGSVSLLASSNKQNVEKILQANEINHENPSFLNSKNIFIIVGIVIGAFFLIKKG